MPTLETAPSLRQYRLPVVPSVEELELHPGWTMTDEALLQSYVDQEAIKGVLAGNDNRYVMMAGPCVAEDRPMNDPTEPVHDAIAFQDVLRTELRAAVGNDPEKLVAMLGVVAALIERMGLRKPRTKHGDAGLLATNPMLARRLPTDMANHGVADPDIKFSLAAELADPHDYELQDRFSLLWSGARHSKVTTLRHIASAPIMDGQSLSLLGMLHDHAVDVSKVHTASEPNPVLHSLFTSIGDQGLGDEATRQMMVEAIKDYHRKPFLFKTGEDGSVEVALDSVEVAAKPQTNTFTGKDGRLRGPITTLGSSNTGVLFRGGTVLTPEAFRNDLRQVQKRIDAYKTAAKRHVGWGADYSHRSAAQCMRGERSEVGQMIAHQIVLEEIKAGNIQPQIFMIESTIHAGHSPDKQWGYSTIDRTVAAKTAATMIVELAATLIAA